MLTLTAREKERKNVMTKRCPDYALPEMVWPGIKEEKREEDTAKKSAGKNEPEGKIQGDWNVDKIEYVCVYVIYVCIFASSIFVCLHRALRA